MRVCDDTRGGGCLPSHPLGTGQWAVDSGQWAVGNGQWTVGSGQWEVREPNVTDASDAKFRVCDPSRLS